MLIATFRCLKLILVLGITSLAGCTTVTVDAPLGEQSSILMDKNLNGAWYYHERRNSAPFYIRKSSDGTISIAVVEQSESGFELMEIKLYVGAIGDAVYISGLFPTSGFPRYAFAKLIVESEGEYVLLAPKAAAFKAMIAQGKLKEIVLQNHSEWLITVKAEGLIRLLESNSSENLWRTERPIRVHEFGAGQWPNRIQPSN